MRGISEKPDLFALVFLQTLLQQHVYYISIGCCRWENTGNDFIILYWSMFGTSYYTSDSMRYDINVQMCGFSANLSSRAQGRRGTGQAE